MERWVGKVAVVTGASAGIGAETVLALAKSGMKVVGVARREERVQALQSELNGAKGELHAKRADISNEEDIIDLFKWVKKTFGTVHVLINNAGIVRMGTLCDQNPKYWRQVLDTNVIGLSICTQECIKLMNESGVDDGHIIHINSVLGHIVPHNDNPMFNMYPPSKWAVTALTEVLRQELRAKKSHIRVTSISPGMTRTEFGQAGNAALEEHERVPSVVKADTPLLEGKDIAEAVVYVLSTPPHVQVHELTIKPLGQYA